MDPKRKYLMGGKDPMIFIGNGACHTRAALSSDEKVINVAVNRVSITAVCSVRSHGAGETQVRRRHTALRAANQPSDSLRRGEWGEGHRDNLLTDTCTVGQYLLGR